MAAKLSLILALVGSSTASYYGVGLRGLGLRTYGGYVRDGAIGVHSGGGISSVARSVQGIGKRSADAEPGWPYGGIYGGYVRDGAIGVHPGGGISSVARSVQGIGKRSAEPSYNAYGCRWCGPRATSYEYRSPQGLGKRSADAEPSYGWGARSVQSVSRALPYGGISSYTTKDNVYGASVYDRRRTPGYGKRSADAEPSYGYGPSSYQQVNRYDGYGQASSYAVRDNVYSAAVNERRSGPYNANAYAFRSGYGKRSADAEPSYGYGPSSVQSVTRALPYGGISTYTTRDNVYSASLYDRRRTPGYGKRSADAEPSYQQVNRYNGYGSASSYAVRDNVYSASVNERRSGPYNANAYGFRSGNGY